MILEEVLNRVEVVKDKNMYILKADTFPVVKDKPQEADCYRTNKHFVNDLWLR